jgi:hypothetical protein
MGRTGGELIEVHTCRPTQWRGGCALSFENQALAQRIEIQIALQAGKKSCCARERFSTQGPSTQQAVPSFFHRDTQHQFRKAMGEREDGHWPPEAGETNKFLSKSRNSGKDCPMFIPPASAELTSLLSKRSRRASCLTPTLHIHRAIL